MTLKKIHILLIIILAVAVGIIISTLSDVSTYATFEQAAAQPGYSFHVIGELSKDKIVNMYTDAERRFFTFFMNDRDDNEQKVVFYGDLPQDFEKSEQLVIVGHFEKDVFVASNILLKCPSKYDEEGLNTIEEFSEDINKNY